MLIEKSDINIFCKNKGWLFEDIKQHFQNKQVTSSELPIKTAKAWISVRSSETNLTPRLDKTIIQVHDLADHDPLIFRHVAGVSFTHPVQYWLWKRMGFTGPHLIQPIGARDGIVPPDNLPARPTIGFFCGESRDMRKGANIFERAVLLAKKNADFDCLLIGRNLEAFAYLGTYESRAADISDYAKIDALFCASVSPAVPLSVYEAQSAGKIVITTPRWFPGGNWPGVKIGENVHQLSKLIESAVKDREANFEKRKKLRRAPYILENWVDNNIKFTINCVNKNTPR